MNLETQRLIGTFLRRKREGLLPEDVGLTRQPRARTPGLRREDVAAMAGISSVWYSKIERGQVDGISHGVLLALSHALRLTTPEHQYLINLVQQHAVHPLNVCLEIGDDSKRLIRQLNPLPAILMNDYFDILAVNDAYSIMCGLDINLFPQEERNYISLLLSSDIFQRFLQAEGNHKRGLILTRIVGAFRAFSAAHPGDINMVNKIRYFLGWSDEFSKLWESEIVTQPEETDYHFTHAVLGSIVLRKQIWLNYSGGVTSRLNVFNPLDESVYRNLINLTTQPIPMISK